MRSLSLFAILALTACSNPQIGVPDFVYCGYLGPAGGPGNACSCVHTLFTDEAPVHYDLETCLTMLQGSVFTDGANFNALQAREDKLCTETSSCTYEQKQAAAALRGMVRQIQKVNPRREVRP